MGRIRFVSNLTSSWTPKTISQLDRGVLQLATDIDRVAKMFAPQETGALRGSGRIERKGVGHYAVIYGSGPVRYARRRHYENQKNPGTLRYLERAGDSQAKNYRRYFKGI